MYLDYFGLKEEPFSLTPDPQFMYLSHQHETALESLLYAVEARKGFLLLTGEIGTGKTTLCRELINRLDHSLAISVVLNPFLSTEGLLKAINQDFGIQADLGGVDEHLSSLNAFLLSRTREGQNAMVLIDEAQNLSVESLEMIRMLSNLETDKAKLLQVLLVGQPELETMLNSFSLRQFNQRVSVRQRLIKLGFKEVGEYINHRLFIAGARGNIIFKATALKAIHHYSQGYPRVLNNLCDRLLLAAFTKHLRIIDRYLVDESYADLQGYTYQRPWWRF